MSNKLILGTVQFGLKYGINNDADKPSQEKIFEILYEASKQGIKILDTAQSYGNAEEIIGAYHRQFPSFLINTKFSTKTIVGDIEKTIDASLQKLNIHQIHILFFHQFKDAENTDYLDELEKIKANKKFQKIGVSVYDNIEFEQAIHNSVIDVIQLPFNLLDNYYQRGSLLKLAKQKGKEIQVRSVFLQGLFFKSFHQYPSFLLPLQTYCNKMRELAAAYKITVEALAISYPFAKTEIDNILIGVDTVNQLQQNLAAINYHLPASLISDIDAIQIQESNLLYPTNWK